MSGDAFERLVAELQTEYRTLEASLIAQDRVSIQSAAVQLMLLIQNLAMRLTVLEAWARGHTTRHQRAVGGRS